MAPYRYTINHPNLKAAARISDIPTKAAIEPLSPETPSHDPDPLPEQELLTYCEPDSLLTLSDSCSHIQVAKSTKVEPVRDMMACSTVADEHEILSLETPSSDPDPLPVQELLTPRKSDSLLSLYESCSQAQITNSAKLEPSWNIIPLSTSGAHYKILVGPNSTTLQAATPLMKQESTPGNAVSIRPESAVIFPTEDRAVTQSEIEEESSPSTCYLLELPVAVRTRIYGHLFGKEQRAVLGLGEAGELKVRFNKSSGIALCFTCRHIEEEARPILYKHLRWVLRKDTPYDSLLSTPFHHNRLIQHVVIHSNGNVQKLNSLAHHRIQFGALRLVIVEKAGWVRTNKAPNRQPWTQLAVSLKDKRAGLSEIWTAAKLLDNKKCKVEVNVACLYYPYMMGKRRDWHEKMGLWCSRWYIDLNRGKVTRVSDRPTEVISGIWPTNGFRFQGHGAARIRVFDEDQVVSEYAGQDGNPFKKAW